MKKPFTTIGTITDESGIRPFIKPKPASASNSICSVTLELVDAQTQEVTWKAEQIVNLQKDGSLQRGDYAQSCNLSVFNDTIFYGGVGVRELRLLFDETNTETPKYMLNEGKVVGVAPVRRDYGGQSPVMGNRNLALTGTYPDPETGDLIHEFTAIFDETRINGEKVNKIALCSEESLSSYNPTYLPQASSHFAFNSHRWVTNPKHAEYNGGGIWDLVIDRTLYATGARRVSEAGITQHTAAYNNLLLTVDPTKYRDADGLYYEYLDIDKRNGSLNNTYTAADLQTFKLEKPARYYATRNFALGTASYYDKVGAKFYFAYLLDGNLNVRVHDATSLVGTLPLLETKVYPYGRELTDMHGLALTMRDGLLEAWLRNPTTCKLARWRLNADGTVTVTDTTLPIQPRRIVHVRDEIYIANMRYSDYNCKNHDQAGQGGFIDLATDSYIQTFTAGFYQTQAISGPSNNVGEIEGGDGDWSHSDYMFWMCAYTARIFAQSFICTHIAELIDTVSPRFYMHIDSVPEFTKDSTKQLKVKYTVRTPKRIGAIRTPFDNLHSPLGSEMILRNVTDVPFQRLTDDIREPFGVKNNEMPRISSLDGKVLPMSQGTHNFIIEDGPNGKMQIRFSHGDGTGAAPTQHTYEFDNLPNGSRLADAIRLYRWQRSPTPEQHLLVDNLLPYETRLYNDRSGTRLADYIMDASYCYAPFTLVYNRGVSKTGAEDMAIATFMCASSLYTDSLPKDAYWRKDAVPYGFAEYHKATAAYIYYHEDNGVWSLRLNYNDGSGVFKDKLIPLGDAFDPAVHKIYAYHKDFNSSVSRYNATPAHDAKIFQFTGLTGSEWCMVQLLVLHISDGWYRCEETSGVPYAVASLDFNMTGYPEALSSYIVDTLPE